MTRRTIVVSGTDSYDHELPPLPCVTSDMDTVAEVFGVLGYEDGARLLNPTADGLRRGLASWARGADRTGDVVVLYYTGHGERDDKGHFLMCRDSEPGQLRSSAVESERIVEILAENGLTRILLILDTCYAGQGAVDALRALARSLASPAVDAGRMTDFSYIAAARPEELAADGAFAMALREAVRDPLLGGPHQRHLHLGDIVQHINGTLRERGELWQKAVHGTLIADGETPFFPNPRYAPGTPAGLDLAEQRVWLLSSEARRRHEERVSHFEPRGRGSDVPSGTASYFTGRTAVLSELTAWLDDGSADLGRSVLVTGGAGVGKSSLLGRLLLLADSDARAVLDDLDPAVPLPATGIDTAIHARHKLLDDIVAGVADAAGVPGAGRRELLTALRARTEPLVVLVDALDEAGTAGADEEPHAIARSFLRELAGIPCVRLLVGARPHVADALGPVFTRIDLADPRWLGPGDIEAYARKLLLAPDGEGSSGPYTAEAARPVAAAVAARAGGNYLCARLIARPLARRERPLDTREPGWEDQLPSLSQAVARPGVEAAFGWALRERMPQQEERARALLTPLAYAEGQGLPATGVWQAMATAVLGRPVGPEDIRRALDGELSELIVEDTDATGRSVYRLYHESFADALRMQAAPATAERLAGALLDLVPVDPGTGMRDWRTADPYLKAHAATHTAAVGLLDALVVDPQFLLTAEPIALKRALHMVSHPQAVAARAAYLRCALILGSQRLAEGDRAAQLHLSALQENADALVSAFGSRFPDRPWEALWSHAAPAPYRALGDSNAVVDDLAVVRWEGREVIVTLEDEGSRVRLSDPTTGEGLGEFLLSPDRRVHHIAACGETDKPWLLVPARSVVPGEQEYLALSVLDLSTGLPLGPELWTKAVATESVAAAEVDGSPVVAVGEPGTVRLLDVRTGRELTRIDGLQKLRPGGTFHVALGEQDGHVVLAAAVGTQSRDTSWWRRHDAHLATWRLDPRQRWSVVGHDRSRAQGNVVQTLAVLRGEAHVATSHGYRAFASYYERGRHHSGIDEWFYPGVRRALGFLTLDRGVCCMVDGGTTVTVRTWGREVPVELPTGGKVKAWATVQDGITGPELVTAGNGPGVRVWDLRDHRQDGTPRFLTYRGLGEHCVAARWAGERVLATSNGPLTLYNPRTGEKVGQFAREPQWLGRSADAGLPFVLYESAGGAISRAVAKALDTAHSPVIPLDGGRMTVLNDLTVVRLGERRMLAGMQSAMRNAVVLWDASGKEVRRWPFEGVSTDMRLRTVEADGVLWVGACVWHRGTRAAAIAVHRFPEEAAAPAPKSPSRPGIRVFDLGHWQGRASIAYFSPSDGALLVEDLAGPGEAEHRELPGVNVLDIVFVGTRDLLAVVTSDERLLFFAPGSADPVASVHAGADIWSVAPVDDQVIGVATANALFALQLPPA